MCIVCLCSHRLHGYGYQDWKAKAFAKEWVDKNEKEIGKRESNINRINSINVQEFTLTMTEDFSGLHREENQILTRG